MVPLERVNDEVFVAKESIVSIGDEEIAFIRGKALASPRQRARICAHKRSEDPLHEMFIALSGHSYIHPHRHRQKSESFHIVEGAVDVVLFDDDGSISDVIPLGTAGTTGRACFYRLDSIRYHTLMIRSEMLVIHEVTNGPFDRRLTEFAPFAPGEDDPAAVAAYYTQLAGRIHRYLEKQST
jgi:cupin fold WbuC family metalloprotein